MDSSSIENPTHRFHPHALRVLQVVRNSKYNVVGRLLCNIEVSLRPHSRFLGIEILPSGNRRDDRENDCRGGGSLEQPAGFRRSSSSVPSVSKRPD